MRRTLLSVAAVMFALMSAGAAEAVERFPPPEFESGHEVPTATHPSRWAAPRQRAQRAS